MDEDDYDVGAGRTLGPAMTFVGSIAGRDIAHPVESTHPASREVRATALAASHGGA